jgi:hypothetical protein
MQEPTIHDLYECRYEPDKLVILIERMHKNSLKTAESAQTAHNNARDETVRCCINCATKCDITVNLEMCYNAGGILFTPRTASTVA